MKYRYIKTTDTKIYQIISKSYSYNFLLTLHLHCNSQLQTFKAQVISRTFTPMVMFYFKNSFTSFVSITYRWYFCLGVATAKINSKSKQQSPS